jgi:adenosylmethionine-8-amino-7-oxononanoate aminotransferase
MAKGLTGGLIPLAVTAASAPIYDAHFSADRSKTFFHSSSFTANPIACAAALANLGIWREEPVQHRIDHIAARHRAFASKLSTRSNIADLRQCGTILAMDFVDTGGGYLSALGPQLLRFFADRNLLLRPLGNTVYIMPPYCVTDNELDALYCGIEAAAAQFAG